MIPGLLLVVLGWVVKTHFKTLAYLNELED